jgi:hypothetical protein
MVHFGGLHEASCMTDRTMPVTADPQSIKALGTPAYWA